jgi:hypothetical protein
MIVDSAPRYDASRHDRLQRGQRGAMARRREGTLDPLNFPASSTN